MRVTSAERASLLLLSVSSLVGITCSRALISPVHEGILHHTAALRRSRSDQRGGFQPLLRGPFVAFVRKDERPDTESRRLAAVVSTVAVRRWASRSFGNRENKY